MLDSFIKKYCKKEKKRERKKTENILIETEKTKSKKCISLFCLLSFLFCLFDLFRSLFFLFFLKTHLPFISIFQSNHHFSHY